MATFSIVFLSIHWTPFANKNSGDGERVIFKLSYIVNLSFRDAKKNVQFQL